MKKKSKVEFEGHTGVWRTVNGSHIFIRDGEDIKTAMARHREETSNTSKKEIDDTETTKDRIEDIKNSRKAFSTYNGNSGYIGSSRSVRATEAENENKYPSSVADKMLGVRSGAVQANLYPSEWHHTGKYFHKTDYYDINLLLGLKTNDKDILSQYDDEDISNAKIKLKELQEWKKPKEEVNNEISKGTINWLTWSGSKAHPKAIKHEMSNVDVIRRGQFYYFLDEDGNPLKKKIDSNGTSFTANENNPWVTTKKKDFEEESSKIKEKRAETLRKEYYARQNAEIEELSSYFNKNIDKEDKDNYERVKNYIQQRKMIDAQRSDNRLLRQEIKKTIDSWNNVRYTTNNGYSTSLISAKQGDKVHKDGVMRISSIWGTINNENYNLTNGGDYDEGDYVLGKFNEKTNTYDIIRNYTKEIKRRKK